MVNNYHLRSLVMMLMEKYSWFIKRKKEVIEYEA